MAYLQLVSDLEVIGEHSFPGPDEISVIQKAACGGQPPTWHMNIFGDLNDGTLPERMEKYYIHNLPMPHRIRKGFSRSLVARVAVVRLVDRYDSQRHKIYRMLDIIYVENQGINILQKGSRLQNMVSMIQHHNQQGGTEREGQATRPRMVLLLGDEH